MSNDYLRLFEKFHQKNESIKEIGKVLGEGAFGQVREIKMNDNKIYAGKLIEKKGQQSEEEKYGVILRGKNIININKILSNTIDDKNYDLILMEKANLRCLYNLNDFFYTKFILKLIYNPFDEVIGDNLLRFYAKQIINALELFDRNYFIHNDIKPQNILVSKKLILKISDFGLLTKVKEKEARIPGGTPGYFKI